MYVARGDEIYCFSEHPIATFNLLTKSTIFNQVNIQPQQRLKQPPWLLQRAAVDLELSSQLSRRDVPELAKAIALEYISKKYRNYTMIYTDGSKTQHGTGLSFYIQSPAVRKAMSGLPVITAYSAESHALCYALSCHPPAHWSY